MIHRLLTWTLLILAPEVVEGRFLASVLAGMAVGRCGRPSRCGRPTSKTWDGVTSLNMSECKFRGFQKFVMSCVLMKPNKDIFLFPFLDS
jgi:hypothetical protein